MKDEHNIILIHASSKWLIHSSGVCSRWVNSRFKCFIFSRSSKISQSYHHEDSSKSLQGFTLYFQLLFLSIILLLQSFSWRLYMVFHQGFLSSFNCSSGFLSTLRSTKLYSKINMVFRTWLILRSSSILLLAFQSAILSTLSFEVVLYHSWQFPFMFRDSHVVKNEVF